MTDYRDFSINNRSNLFVRFAADANGTDFSDKPSPSRRYIGVLASGHRLNLPIREDFAGLWQEYRGRDGSNAEVSIDPVTYTWIINGVDTGVIARAHDTILAKSYAVGQTMARPNEDYDNAMYYKNEAEKSAKAAELALGDIEELKEQVYSQNEVIQGHIEEVTNLTQELNGKIEHVNEVQVHVDGVKEHVDEIDTQLTDKYNIVVQNTEQIAQDKSDIITIQGQINQSVLTVTQAANQVSDDKSIIVRAKELADGYRQAAASSALEAASYAHGNTGIRDGEDTDNGLYYLTQVRNQAGDVSADLATVQAAQEDVTAKASQVNTNAQQVDRDKTDITTMKNTVVEKHGEVVTMNGNVETLHGEVVTIKGELDTQYDDILDKASQVSNDTAAVSVMKNWITTNTQISHVYIDEHGVLHENRVGADLFSFSLDENGKLVVTDLKQPNRHAELGVTTAYGYAKAGGYTGTEEDFIARIQEILNATLDTFSGDYNDLTNKPTIPSKTSELTNDSNFQTAQQVQAAVSPKADASALTAHTGNTTVHITASERSSWNAKSNFSGSYNDLTDKPTIPTTAADVGAIPASEKGAANGVAQLDADGKVDVSQFPVAGSSSGQTGGVWTAADNGVSTDSTGKLSIVQAGSDAIAGRSSSTQPIVPSNLNEAVAAAVSDSNHMTLNASQQATAQSVFHVPDIDATGSSLGLAVDPTTYVMTMTLKNASGTTIDTKTVDLPLESMVIGATCTNGVLTLTLQSGATVNVDVSSLVSGLIPSSEKGANNGVATLGNDGKVPSAQLPTIPTSLADLTEDSTHHTVTADEKSAWNAKSDFSGDYNDLGNKPAIPSKTSDLTNDSGFQTSSDVQSAVSGKANASDLAAHTGNTTIHVTAAEKEAWNGKSDFNGSYNSLTDKPTIPTQLSQLAEDSTHRTVTDAEKASWEGKSGFDGDYNNLTNKPTIPATAADVGAIPTTEKGANNGVATLGNDGKVPSAQLPPISSVPDPITALVDPTNTTVGVPGRLYLNTYADKAFVCSGSYNAGTAQSPSLRYSWMPIVAGSGGSVWKNVIISQQDNNTVDTSSKPVLIVGNSNTQSQALASAIVGHDITQNVCNQSAAVGQHITQNGCGDSLAIGVYISQRVCEAVLMSGIYLTSYGSGESGAAYFGLYNTPVPNVLRVTGNGSSDSARKNIEELSTSGDLYITGGYRQAITEIPAATSAYTLAEGVYIHTPASAPTYTLPAVTDATRTRYIELTVKFTNVQSYSFVDSSNTAITPVTTPTISAGDIYTFRMEYSSFLSRWVITPERHGASAYVSDSALAEHTGNTTIHVTSTEKAAWNAKSNFSGSYNDLTNKPTIPTALSDLTQTANYHTVTDSEKAEWSGKVSGITLNGEDLEQDEDGIVNISALAVVHTTVPNANTSEQSYMLYLGETNASYKKGHLYERAIEPGTTVAYDRVTVHAYDTEYHFDASNNTTGPWTCNDGNIRLKYEQIGPDTGWWEFTDHTTNDSGYLHNLHSNEVASTDMPWTSAITGWYHEDGNQEIISVTRDVGEEVVPGTDYEWKDLGGSDKEIDEIPSLVTAYSLQEGVARHELGSGYCTYTLPEVRDTSITHEVVVTVMFATATDSCMFLDYDENEITPLSTPEIEAGTVVSYLCSYDVFLESWAIMPVVYGKKEV